MIRSRRFRSTWERDSSCCIISFTCSVFVEIVSFKREFSVFRVASDTMSVWRFSILVRKKLTVRVICWSDSAYALDSNPLANKLTELL